MAKQGIKDSSSIDQILINLTRRPDVRSTLILSRKDGSIIRASGAISDDIGEISQRDRSHNSTDIQLNEGKNTIEGIRTTEPGDSSNSRAQLLASSVYAFVAAAESLGSSLQSVNGKDNPFSTRTDGEVDQEGQARTVLKAQPEDDVQLLRLRLKKEEIIIFPDPSYLCCVVQNLEKTSR